ncbi:MAG TPA: PD-(D/E)XK motif protein [Iamia sp.]|nr:PD-(D/E)XK motif protein [Iamia sp.]
MARPDLATLWTVLRTEAGDAGSSVEVAPTGARVGAGEVLAGVDGEGRRHLLIPLLPGEAFAQDTGGRSVHLLRLAHEGTTYLSAVCTRPELDGVFGQFATDLVEEIAGADSPARTTVATLDRWRDLFAEADGAQPLGESSLIGLLAELMTLEEILALDPLRRLEVWTGPTGSQHDFRSGPNALEVKATLVREGRVVSISSVDQLVAPDGGGLHLLHHRVQADPGGDSLPAAVDRVRGLGVEGPRLMAMLAEVGYRAEHADQYRARTYSVVERRAYDVEGEAFPRIVPGSFRDGVLPPGTLRLSYSIDLSNEPPRPLDDASTATVLGAMASG